MANRWQMVDDRNSGMTYKQIGAKYAVPEKFVERTLRKYNPFHFRAITEASCVYPNLRRWMNENKVNVPKFIELMEYEPHNDTLQRLRNVMRGRGNARKDYIDKLLAITGMTYEKLFALEVDDG